MLNTFQKIVLIKIGAIIEANTMTVMVFLLLKSSFDIRIALWASRYRIEVIVKPM